MLFTCKNFMFYNFKWKKFYFVPWNGEAGWGEDQALLFLRPCKNVLIHWSIISVEYLLHLKILLGFLLLHEKKGERFPKSWKLIMIFCNELYYETCRTSHRRFSVRKSVLRSFTKFTGKHLCQSLFFNKVAGLRPLGTPFSQNTFGRLLL